MGRGKSSLFKSVSHRKIKEFLHHSIIVTASFMIKKGKRCLQKGSENECWLSRVCHFNILFMPTIVNYQNL